MPLPVLEVIHAHPPTAFPRAFHIALTRARVFHIALTRARVGLKTGLASTQVKSPTQTASTADFLAIVLAIVLVIVLAIVLPLVPAIVSPAVVFRREILTFQVTSVPP